MTVKELRKILKECDDDAVVLIPVDDDYDGFEEVEAIETGMAIDDDGIIGIPVLTEELERAGYGEDDVVDGPDCVILNP